MKNKKHDFRQTRAKLTKKLDEFLQDHNNDGGSDPSSENTDEDAEEFMNKQKLKKHKGKKNW